MSGLQNAGEDDRERE